jgi:hypothetical protein
MSLSLDDIADEPAKDFRRANGAPMVKRPDGSDKWERYSRPSSMGRDLEDESNLVNWKIDRALDGVVMDRSLQARIAAGLGQKEGRKELREQAIQTGRGSEAADLGTALHAITQRVEEDKGFKVVAPYDADVAAYLTFLDRAGLTSKFIEVKMCSDEWRCAGTFDRIYEASRRLLIPGFAPLEPGDLILADLKTGMKLDYSHREYTIQTAIYVDGCFYDVDTDERTPYPDRLRTDVGLLVHLPVGEAVCTPLWVDLQVGREGAHLVKAIRAWRKRTDNLVPFAYPDGGDLDAAASAELSVDEPVEGGGSRTSPALPADEDVEWITAMMSFAQDRVNIIGRYSNEARNFLLRRWPVGVAPLTEHMPTGEQMAAILDTLDAVESAYSIPFPAGDPRPEWNRGKRKQDADARRLRNQPPSHGAEIQ